jgi:hypothetical protein
MEFFLSLSLLSGLSVYASKTNGYCDACHRKDLKRIIQKNQCRIQVFEQAQLRFELRRIQETDV